MNPIITDDDIDFEKYMKDTEPMTSVHEANTWDEDLTKLITEGSVLSGATLPWSKTHELIRFRPGEVSVWAGIGGHGKSLLAGFVAMGFINQGENICNASLEMKPQDTLHRKLRQASMTHQPTILAKDRFLAWAKGRLFIYDHIGVMEQEKLFASMRYTAKELNVKHFFIDNLGLCIRDSDDQNQEKHFIVKCMALAKELSIHVHIIHHIRKLQDESKTPGKFDIKGSGDIVNYVDQAIIVHRNKAKEYEIQTLKHKGQEIPMDVKNKSDVVANVVKNRGGGWEGRIHLWYDPASLQYRGDPSMKFLKIIGE